MKIVYRKILFCFVLLVLLLHSVIPHDLDFERKINDNFVESKKENSILDVMKLVFYENAGGNLDNLSFSFSYSYTHNLSDNYDLFGLPNSLLVSNIIYPLNNTKPFCKINSCRIDFIVELHTVRGPPV